MDCGGGGIFAGTKFTAMRPSLYPFAFALLTSTLLGAVACGGGRTPSMPPPEEAAITAVDVAGDPELQTSSFIVANGLSGEQKTASGLTYVIEAPGGDEKPTVDSDITIYYHGYLVDGKTFDKTKSEPRTFPLSGLIPAWQEAIPLIGRGGKIKILAPPSTAYGNNPPAGTGITNESVLVFDITLVDFEG